MRGIGSFPHRFAASPQFVNPSRCFGASTYSIRLSAYFVYSQRTQMASAAAVHKSPSTTVNLCLCNHIFRLDTREVGEMVRVDPDLSILATHDSQAHKPI